MMTPRRFLAAGVGLAMGLGVWAGAAAQLSSLSPPPPPTSEPSRGAPPEADDLIRSDFSLKQREDRLGALLDRSVADGSLGKREYARANTELAAIRAAEDRMRSRHHGELTDADTFRLEGHIKALIASIRWKS